MHIGRPDRSTELLLLRAVDRAGRPGRSTELLLLLLLTCFAAVLPSSFVDDFLDDPSTILVDFLDNPSTILVDFLDNILSLFNRNSYYVPGDIVSAFAMKLKLLKRRIIWWRKNIYGSLGTKKKIILSTLETVEKQIDGV